mmetsp:Transcript_19056/g.26487  ORF Transcript_19056/g.26487 Transcript_19056/m.26487 type:complete len:250 (-) Transcript_19056:1273-2022(-)
MIFQWKYGMFFQRRKLGLQAQNAEEKGKSTSLWDNPKFVEKVISKLEHKKITRYCAVLFTATFLMVFVNPPNFGIIFRGDDTFCSARASLIAFLVWVFWILPYLYFVSRTDQIDPYNVIFKIRMETLTVGLVSIATAILILGFEPVVGTSHWGLLNYDVTWFMQMTVWYCESYLPVKYTKQKLALMKEIVPTSHKLEKTLVDEELLLKFELHLIDEWSPENLQFFKNAVICRYQIQKNYESGEIIDFIL